jgi:bacterial/archaeal transporter family protein
MSSTFTGQGFAILSAVFAAMTAILGKLGVALVMLAGWLVPGEPFTLKAAAGCSLIVLGSLILLL